MFQRRTISILAVAQSRVTISLRLTGRTVRRNNVQASRVQATRVFLLVAPLRQILLRYSSAFVDASYLQSPSDRPINQQNVDVASIGEAFQKRSRLTGRKRRVPVRRARRCSEIQDTKTAREHLEPLDACHHRGTNDLRVTGTDRGTRVSIRRPKLDRVNSRSAVTNDRGLVATTLKPTWSPLALSA